MSYVGFGLGCGRFSTATADQKKESTAIIHAAVERGIVLLNTADFYGSGESELAIRHALQGLDRSKVFIAVKFGSLTDPAGRMYGLDVHPDRVKNYLAQTLRRLGTDYVDMYQPARIDQGIPVEETVGAIADLVGAGYVRHIGLSQVDADTLRRAYATHPILCTEMEYSLFNRSMEQDILPVVRELGGDVVAFGILAHGLLSGTWTPERIARGELPRSQWVELLQKGNIEKNLVLVARLQQIADEEGITLSQLVHAWSRTKGNDVIPLIGASSLRQFEESAQAQSMKLSEETVRRMEAAVPAHEVAGSSFPNPQYKNGVVIR